MKKQKLVLSLQVEEQWLKLFYQMYNFEEKK